MQKYIIIFVCILSQLFNDLSGKNSDIPGNKTILVLFSLSPTAPAYKVILEGIREEISRQYGDSYTLHSEYLETDKIDRVLTSKEKFDLFNIKYAGLDIDLLICVGTNIVKEIKQFADDRIKNLPSVILDLDFEKYGIHFDMSLNERSTVIGLKIEPGRSISDALKIFPSTSTIHFIVGKARLDSFLLKVSLIEATKIDKRIRFDFTVGKPMDDVLSYVKKLQEGDLIMVASFSEDGYNVPYYNNESVRLISSSTNVPVFGYTDMGFGDGAFGGSMLSYRKAGLLAGNAAVKIMKGTDPQTIKISENDYYEYLLDWRVLKKFKLERLAQNVKDSVVRYREITFFSRYKWPISGAIVFLILQSLMIASLIRLNRKQKMMTRRIVEADRKYIDIIREDRILRMGMLTASLSHELNQPLTAILSTAQAGTKFIEAENRDPNLLKELFQNIAEDNNRAASILKSIKGLMKMEKREKEKVNLNDLILQVTDLYHSKAIEMHSTLNISLLPKPVFVLGDAIQIQQVLLNLISNASHSMEKSNGNSRTVNIKETLENGHVSISVRDYGTGIDESVRSKLFEPFVTSKRDGVGIGLSLSRLIVEDHGGKIRARNMPDGGAEFTFSLKILDERGN